MKSLRSSRSRNVRNRRAPTRAGILRFLAWSAAALLACAIAVIAVFDRNGLTNCASRTVRAQILTEISEEPGASVFALAEQIHQPAAIVLDAWPDAQRVGVDGQHLNAVWASLQSWRTPVIFLGKSGQSFRVHAQLSSMHLDRMSGEWHLGDNDDAVTGRLRADNIGSIYAWIARPHGKLSPAVSFLDRRGDELFTVSPGNVFEEPLAALPPDFAATFRLMQMLEPSCATPH